MSYFSRSLSLEVCQSLLLSLTFLAQLPTLCELLPHGHSQYRKNTKMHMYMLLSKQTDILLHCAVDRPWQIATSLLFCNNEELMCFGINKQDQNSICFVYLILLILDSVLIGA